ncbi:MAG: DNRLRE domain-containing protein, partial [Gammaproteobacteria bacterium]|nr:DNRLRE domain-containing protein [Gammaproteobacteria bacterium]
MTRQKWGHSRFSAPPIMGNVPNKQRGFILLTVVVAITLLAAIAFVLGYQGASQAGIAAGEFERDQLRYVAEAGMAHAKSQLAQNTSCASYTDLPATTFGSGSYSATITPDNNSPVSITATGQLQNGAKLSVMNNSVRTYQPATTLTLQMKTTGGKDAILDDFYPIRNYGGVNYVKVNSGSWNQRPVIEFDLSTVPAGVTIQSARLELRQWNVGNPGNVAVRRVTRSWSEGTKNGGGIADGATWTTYDGTSNWLQPGGEFNATTYASTYLSGGANGKFVAWDISELVREWVSGQTPNHGLMLTGDGSVTNAEFASKDTNNVGDAPKLTITYACECGLVCGAPPVAGTKVLLVVSDDTNPTAQDLARQALIESFGFAVTLIDDGALQAKFDTATAVADVAYLSEE